MYFKKNKETINQSINQFICPEMQQTLDWTLRGMQLPLTGARINAINMQTMTRAANHCASQKF